jgi:hypothetical protein
MIYSKVYASLLVTGLAFLSPSVTLAQSDIRAERVEFDRGASSTVIAILNKT